jgi:uncharacterized repeat protein (TIGR03803 family)
MNSRLTSPAWLLILIILVVSYAPFLRAQSSSIHTLFAFTCDSSTNVCPKGKDASSLIQSGDGNFYGTTEFGGTGTQAAGTVFKLTPAGQLTTVYTFVDSANGANPTSLVEGNDGFLYGTTNAGGANNQGVVFRVSKAGSLQVLHSFCSLANCADGNQPFNLVLGNDGNLYGCTTYSFPGTLFRVTPRGSYTLLHTFSIPVDGPQCIGMTVASDGNIYGDTLGASGIPTVVFRLTPAGQVSVVHTLEYSQFPVSPVTQTSNGRLWSVLSHIAGEQQAGMFEVGLSGTGYKEIPLPYPFEPPDVHFMTQASDGNFWGILGQSIVRFTLGGKSLEQIPFPAANSNVSLPVLMQASNGQLIGFSNDGGFDLGDPGEIFALEPALAPPKPLFVSFIPSSGLVGSQVVIHGVHFVGTTAVKFNGVSAKFQVLNTGNIKATVPAGATTGPVTVVNQGGATATTKSFTVTE